MDCQYCKKEMEKGYIQCRDGVNWTKTKKPVASLTFLSRDCTPLFNAASKDGKAVFAYKCEDCKKVIIQYC